MEKPNFQRETEKAIERLCVVSRPPLLLHACCAPCSSYVLEYLTQYFSITLFFCNPNITDPAEYQKRLAELRRFCAEAPFCRDVTMVEDSISSEAFLRAAAGLEDAPEAAGHPLLGTESHPRHRGKQRAAQETAYQRSLAG